MRLLLALTISVAVAFTPPLCTTPCKTCECCNDCFEHSPPSRGSCATDSFCSARCPGCAAVPHVKHLGTFEVATSNATSLVSACLNVTNELSSCEAFAGWHAEWRQGTYDASHPLFAERVRAFRVSLLRISDVARRNPLATFAPGRFADWTASEFARMQGTRADEIGQTTTGLRYRDVPDEIDWAARGNLTAVRDQGHCGSCWAHAAVETVAAYLSIKHAATPVALSVQQVVSCDTTASPGNCDGGNPAQALSYVAASGLETEQAYPIVSGHMSYNCGGTLGIQGNADFCVEKNFGRCLSVPNSCPTSSAEDAVAEVEAIAAGEAGGEGSGFCLDGKCGADSYGCCLTEFSERPPTTAREARAAAAHVDAVLAAQRAAPPRAKAAAAAGGDNSGKQCLYDSGSQWGKISSHGSVHGEADYQQWVGSSGPLAITLYATDLQHYKGGVMTACPSAPAGRIDHAVQLVGFGTDGGVDYWKVRNSWGAGWGEGGYVRMQRGNNLCNLASYNGYYPIV